MNWFKKCLIGAISFALIMATAIGLAIFGFHTHHYYNNTYVFFRVLSYIVGGYFALILILVYLCHWMMEMDASGEIESEDAEEDIEKSTRLKNEDQSHES